MKVSAEIIQKIRSLEIHTKRILAGGSTGEYTSKKRGFGLEFDQLRDYQTGDDVRSIDWKSTARANKLLVREYLQERNKTIMVVVDFSASMYYASRSQDLKSDIAAQIASVIALVTISMRDMIGVVIVHGTKNIVIPPGRGRSHVHYIMQQLFSCTPEGGPSLNEALRTVLQMNRKDMMVVIISDFLLPEYERMLLLCSRRHETIVIHSYDPLERTFVNVGLLNVQDPETGKTAVVATRSGAFRKFLEEHEQKCNASFRRARVDVVPLAVDEPFIGKLIKFFRKRMV